MLSRGYLGSLISIHVPTRGTTPNTHDPLRQPDFNPRAHEGHDAVCEIQGSIAVDFNPRAHEGHDPGQRQCDAACSHFNPRAHEGHDCNLKRSYFLGGISIHVPTRGTTFVCTEIFKPHIRISIHVPTRGTTGCQDPQRCTIDFNPRAHEGHDSCRDRCYGRVRISIHVPTRGTTIRYGCTVRASIFQSTCPRGARRYRSSSTRRDLYFNPRAHEGHDKNQENHICLMSISIHVPTRGTTHSSLIRRWRHTFQSTCPRGARPRT